MGKEWTRQQLQAAAEALRAVFEDVSVVELPPESEGRWQDDAMQVSYEQGGGQVSCVLRRRIPVKGGWCGIQMSAPLAGNTLPEDRMTERERELLREDLNRDFLTGAYNRRYIETVLSRQVEADMQAGRRAAVALLSLDEGSTAEDIAADMKEAIGGVHTALVTYAARDSEFDGHQIHAGEYLALLDGALIGSYTGLDELVDELATAADALDPAVISVYYGEDVSGEEAEATAGALGGRFPDAELTVVDGGQPVYYYMISIE